MSVVVTTAVAALSALTGVASFLVYLYFGRRSDLVAAREEALALAETRRQVIHDLRERLKSGEKQRLRAKAIPSGEYANSKPHSTGRGQRPGRTRTRPSTSTRLRYPSSRTTCSPISSESRPTSTPRSFGSGRC
jgi:hypothetical protein